MEIALNVYHPADKRTRGIDEGDGLSFKYIISNIWNADLRKVLVQFSWRWFNDNSIIEHNMKECIPILKL